MDITNAQIKKIHTLLTKHGISDEDYRKILMDKFFVCSSSLLDEEQASELIEHLIKITGDTYDKDNNTEYYQKAQEIQNKGYLIKNTIINFAKGYNIEELLGIIFEVTTLEQNISILHKLIK